MARAILARRMHDLSARVARAILEWTVVDISFFGFIFFCQAYRNRGDKGIVGGHTLYVNTILTSDKNILYARRLVVYRNQRRWWCKKQGNKDCD